jgi:RNA binding exosome subunit
MQSPESRKVTLSEVIISTLCHATENCSKVKQAILNLIPPHIAPSTHIAENTVKGFYGNLITVLEARFKGKEAYSVLKHVANLLSELDRRYVVNSLEIRYDPKANKVFIRIDKQSAYLNKPTVSEGDDTVKLVLSFSMLRSAEGVRKLLEEIFFGKGAQG